MDDILERLEMKTKDIEIPEKTKEQWQKLLEMLVEKSGAEDALLTEYDKPYLKIIKFSQSRDGNFKEGDRIKLSGHYCQAVIENKKTLEVNNAAADPDWEEAPELELGLNSYLGYPILWPTGEVFGTICIHDNQQRKFSSELKEQLKFSRNLIENNLEIFYQNQLNNNLRQYYSKLINILPVGVMIEDAAGNILKVNKVMEEITGYKREKLLQSSVFETVVPDNQGNIARKNNRKSPVVKFQHKPEIIIRAGNTITRSVCQHFK